MSDLNAPFLTPKLTNDPPIHNNPAAGFLFQELCRGRGLFQSRARLSKLGLSDEILDLACEVAESRFRELGEAPANLTSGINLGPHVKESFVSWSMPHSLMGDIKISSPCQGVTVIDGFLSDSAFSLYQTALSKIPLSFGKTSKPLPTSVPEVGFWYSPLAVYSDSATKIDLARTTAFKSLNMLDELWSHATSFTGAKNLSRVYTNAQTYGTDPVVHRDDPYFYRNICDAETVPKTILIYMNDQWDCDWGGETSFFTDSGEIMASVLPKKGRAVIFDGTIRHGARPLSRYFTGMRQILVFKTTCFSLDATFPAYDWVNNLVLGIPHSKTSFYSHLSGTAGILRMLGFDDYLVWAALCHALYGTQYFNGGVSVDRATLVEKIGVKAESLVHLFCSLENRTPRLLSGSVDCTELEYRDLLLIEYANMVEQAPRFESIRDNKTVEKIREILLNRFAMDLPQNSPKWPEV